MVIELLIGAAVAGGTYAFAKKRKASTGQSATAAGVAGVGSAVAAAAVTALFWPLLLIGTPLAVGYYIGKKKTPKALPPGRV